MTADRSPAAAQRIQKSYHSDEGRSSSNPPNSSQADRRKIVGPGTDSRSPMMASIRRDGFFSDWSPDTPGPVAQEVTHATSGDPMRLARASRKYRRSIVSPASRN